MVAWGSSSRSCRAPQTNDSEIIAAGSFLQADDQPAWGIAKWDGKQWTKPGTTPTAAASPATSS
ncbi:MAG: hypothetical protein R3B67_09460 [Phycisphaerales bacterium]